MAEALRHALARPQRHVMELRVIVVLGVMDSLDELTIPHTVFNVQGHV